MAGAGIVDFDLDHADDHPPLARVGRILDDARRAFEIAQRNANALATWQMCRALGTQFPDAARSPDDRLILDRWIEARREVAQGWLSRSLFFRRQAD